MSKLVYCCLVFLTSSCGPGWSDYTEELSGGYVYLNQGQGFNAISSQVKGVATLHHLRKYDDNGRYICAWQADSTRLASLNFRPVDLRKDTYDLSDQFYIIDIDRQKLYGPYTKNKFFEKAKSLDIQVSWKPVTQN